MEYLKQAIRGMTAQWDWLPNWAVTLVLLILAAYLADLLHRILFSMLTRIAERHDLFWRALASRVQGPARLGMIALALAIGASVAPVTPVWAGAIRHGLLVCFIVLLGWSALTAFHIWMVVHLRRFKLDAEDNLLARKHVTQTRILRRVVNVLIVIVTVSAALMTFDGVRQYGVSLLASAGAAGMVVGFALQPLLKNLIAGIQLAITQPIRIDDALLVENEWGNVEEITSTYVVVRLWDWRRLVLPLGYFIEKPFQNWTREGSSLIGTVMIYLDYSLPVGVLRRKVEEIAAASALWDGEVVNVQVTDFRQATMEVRILISASSAGHAFDLRCEMREKVIAFLQQEYPDSLPRLRAAIAGQDNERLPALQERQEQARPA